MNAPGELVDGRFELIERLGSGGMGTVWRARDTVLHREVALKAVRSDASASEAVRERVLREARAPHHGRQLLRPPCEFPRGGLGASVPPPGGQPVGALPSRLVLRPER